MIQYLKRLSRFESPTKLDWMIYFGFFAILHIPAILNFYDNEGVNNAYLKFSESLLKGNLTLPAMNSYSDMILYQGQYYLPYPPFPSFLLAPFVAIFGSAHVNTVFVVLIMSCLNLYLLYKIFIKLQVPANYFTWLLLAFFFGTGYWFTLFTSHHVYSFAHITSCTLLLLFLNELLSKRRWWLMGVYIGCSFLTRQFTIFYVVLALGYLFYLYRQPNAKLKLITTLIPFLVSIGFFIGIYMIYNYLRFHNAFDPGYNYILYNGILRERVNAHGVFSASYVPFNLYSYFIKGFNVEFEGNGMMNIHDMDIWGTSLIAASPFLVTSIKAGWPRLLKISCWLTIIFILIGQLFYHNNGFHQVNTMRFSLDFLPVLFVLAALGVKYMPAWLFKAMVAYAIFLNVLSFIIHYKYQ